MGLEQENPGVCFKAVPDSLNLTDSPEHRLRIASLRHRSAETSAYVCSVGHGVSGSRITEKHVRSVALPCAGCLSMTSDFTSAVSGHRNASHGL